MMKKEIKITCEGLAIVPHLRKAGMYNGIDMGYSVQLKLDDDANEAMYGMLSEELQKIAALPEFAGKSFENAQFPYDKKSGNLKFKASSKLKLRNGQTIDRKIPIFDNDNTPLPLEQDIMFNDVIKIAYTIFPYYIDADRCGISLQIEAVQLVARAGVDADVEEDTQNFSAENFGFNVCGNGTQQRQASFGDF